jgi:hypothetical protein
VWVLYLRRRDPPIPERYPRTPAAQSSKRQGTRSGHDHDEHQYPDHDHNTDCSTPATLHSPRSIGRRSQSAFLLPGPVPGSSRILTFSCVRGKARRRVAIPAEGASLTHHKMQCRIGGDAPGYASIDPQGANSASISGLETRLHCGLPVPVSGPGPTGGRGLRASWSTVIGVTSPRGVRRLWSVVLSGGVFDRCRE